MDDMFDALASLGKVLSQPSYESRKVSLYKTDWGGVSTASVAEGEKPFETAVLHPDYNDDNIVIVEAYDTFEQAVEGHQKWVNIMSTEPLPMELVDCANSKIAKILLRAGKNFTFPRTINGFFVAEEPKQLPSGGNDEHGG